MKNNQRICVTNENNAKNTKRREGVEQREQPLIARTLNPRITLYRTVIPLKSPFSCGFF